MTKTYKKLQNLFEQRTDALCEDRLPEECNCNECPCALICTLLCSCDPSEEVPEVWLRQVGL